MFYQLNTLLQGLPGARLMTYISFRAILAAVLAMLISILLGEYFINFMKRHQFFEQQRDEKIDPFNVGKKGVPTMGGVVVLTAILIPCFLVGRLSNVYMLLMIATTLILGTLGFIDDYIKTFRHNKDGLNGWVKIAGQVLVGLLVGLTLRYSPVVTMNETVNNHVEDGVTYVVKSPSVKSTRTTIPFFKHHNFNYADMFSFLGEENKYRAGWIFFVLLTVFVVAAVSNGANLNDGMDGMCAGNSAIIGIALIVLAYISGSVVWANYFDVMYIPHSEELVVFLGAFVGALIGYLWWNSFPAQIFMGDTGSLAIGGIIGVGAVLIHKELLIPILCGVFLMESVSVILQTQVYKFHKKRNGSHVRVWKRTPIHDHFRTSMEQVLKVDPTCVVRFKGRKNLDHESKIVLRFCIVTLILAAFTILTLKIR
ncbi:MAG: phospho-N-acetylmuramoyl-pentapeptide-transferase [Paludibacteraceae bacterium]|nr:phospho-N-acetylmuramoyl-pentapeptide-transferase [Paludibacteraceae bacterium]MBQ2608139.1 phospho-N-acetylmuramoyl-pentapeptide-transferase [Paludibacteraceae bacterium]